MLFAIGYVFLIVSAVVGLAHLAQVSWLWWRWAAAGTHFLHRAGFFLLVARSRMTKPLFRATASELKKDREWLRTLTRRPGRGMREGNRALARACRAQSQWPALRAGFFRARSGRRSKSNGFSGWLRRLRPVFFHGSNRGGRESLCRSKKRGKSTGRLLEAGILLGVLEITANVLKR